MSEVESAHYTNCKKAPRVRALMPLAWCVLIALHCCDGRGDKERKMKLIIAYIQPERLNAVKQALFAREIYKMSVTNALGCGKQGGFLHLYRGAVEEVTLHKKMRLAIGVNDDYIEKTIEAIIEGARTGDIGDG